MKVFLAISALLIIFAGVIAEQQDTIVTVNDGDIRTVTVITSPANYPSTAFISTTSITTEKQGEYDFSNIFFNVDVKNKVSVAFGHTEGSTDYNPSGGIGTDIQTLAYFFSCFNIVEYDEVNGEEGFQLSDNVIGWYNLTGSKSPSWKPLTCDSSVTSGAKVWVCNAETSDEVFALRFTAAEQTIKINDETVKPGNIKIDVTIQYYENDLFTGPTSYSSGPSSAVDHPNARVALLTGIAGVSGEIKAVVGTSDSNPSVVIGGGNVDASFSWIPTAVVAGGNVKVQSTVTDLNNYQMDGAFSLTYTAKAMTFGFDAARPAKIYWDPKYGVEGSDISNSATVTFSLALLFVAFVLSL